MKKIGLAGLPNAGKSSIFKLLTKKDVLIANYSFSTIKPNTECFTFFDGRINKIKSFFKKPIVKHAELKITDIPGIVKNASKNIGMGNRFISQMRECDLIIIVLKFFNIIEEDLNLETEYDSFNDFETIKTEFVISDLEQVDKKIEKNNNLLTKEKGINYNIIKKENAILEKIKENLINFKFISEIEMNNNDREMLKKYDFLTNKPYFVIANFSNNSKKNLEIFKSKVKSEIVELNVKEEIKKIEKEERIFENEKFFNKIKDKLNLKVFFTAGEKEVKSWIINNNASAKECAGLIHSDIKERLIRVSLLNEDKCNELKDLIKNREKEKKDYIIKDGEICEFIFN